MHKIPFIAISAILLLASCRKDQEEVSAIEKFSGNGVNYYGSFEEINDWPADETRKSGDLVINVKIEGDSLNLLDHNYGLDSTTQKTFEAYDYWGNPYLYRSIQFGYNYESIEITYRGNDYNTTRWVFTGAASEKMETGDFENTHESKKGYYNLHQIYENTYANEYLAGDSLFYVDFNQSNITVSKLASNSFADAHFHSSFQNYSCSDNVEKIIQEYYADGDSLYLKYEYTYNSQGCSDSNPQNKIARIFYGTRQ